MYNYYFSALVIPPLHPVMPGTVSCILGIVCASLLPTTSYLYLLLAVTGITVVLTSLIYILYLQKIYFYTVIACLSLFIMGFYRYHFFVHKYTELKQQLVSKQACYTGTVQAVEQTTHKYYRHSLTLRIASIKHDLLTPVINNPGYILKYYYNTQVPVTPGDTLSITSTINYSTNPFEKYLLKESVLAHVFTKSLDYKHCTNTHTTMQTINNNIKRMLAHTQYRMIQNLKAHLSPLTYTLFSSLFLGLKPTHEHYRQSIKTACTQWGIVHYLARSGLHIVLIITLWSMIIAVLPLPYSIKQVMLMGFVVIYYIFTWPSISFIRAFITFMLYKLCLFTSRPAHSFYAVTLTCLIVLLYNPLQLFFLDFQLSFGLTAVLAWFNEVRVCKINLIKHR